MQGGPHMHTISAMAVVVVGEASTPDFEVYAKQVLPMPNGWPTG
jgi:glycine/serine hydroxymethyltransferase